MKLLTACMSLQEILFSAISACASDSLCSMKHNPGSAEHSMHRVPFLKMLGREVFEEHLCMAQGLLEDVHAERQAREAEDIPEVDEHGKKLTKKQQAAAKKKAEAERTKQTQDEGTRIDAKVTGHVSSTAHDML